MNLRIFYGILFLVILSTGTVFAQEDTESIIPPITVQTDDKNYDEGDTIVISGKVITAIKGVNIVLQLFTEGNMIEIAQITIAQDGTYSHTILAEGPLWKKSGTYVVRSSYEVGGGTIAEAEFEYVPKSDIVETKENFEVNAGSRGTFDVEYTIKGGIVNDIIINSNNFALEVEIETTDDGSITLDLPREFIGAEKQDGKDDVFIILIDGIDVAYEESVVLSESRKITITFEEDDSKIEIIGTYVVPEFGTMIMMILVIGIIVIIISTRNKFQIKI
jgi:predicted secreted protein with PEFG-CTERM motif